jgi:hypothetical protein
MEASIADDSPAVSSIHVLYSWKRLVRTPLNSNDEIARNDGFNHVSNPFRDVRIALHDCAVTGVDESLTSAAI